MFEIPAGVPQGSRRGPLLWIIFITDIQVDLESAFFLFADETCLFASDIDPALKAKVLNRDLGKISAWAKKWKVILMQEKVKIYYFQNQNILLIHFHSFSIIILLQESINIYI